MSTSTLGSPREKAGSNIYFLNHMVLPLFQQLSSIEPSFEQLIKQVTRNR